MFRDVSADVPSRMPPGVCADASPETAFSARHGQRAAEDERGVRVALLMVMPTRSQSFSSLLPVRPSGRTSQSTRWLSVPFV